MKSRKSQPVAALLIFRHFNFAITPIYFVFNFISHFLFNPILFKSPRKLETVKHTKHISYNKTTAKTTTCARKQFYVEKLIFICERQYRLNRHSDSFARRSQFYVLPEFSTNFGIIPASSHE